jgi:hypothetical protein
MTTEKDIIEMEEQLNQMTYGFIYEMGDLLDGFQDLMRKYISHLRDVYLLTEQISREVEDIICGSPEV